MDDLARRRSLLTAGLGFALIDTKGKPAPKEIQLVREWLDNWKGLGHVVTGCAISGEFEGAGTWAGRIDLETHSLVVDMHLQVVCLRCAPR